MSMRKRLISCTCAFAMIAGMATFIPQGAELTGSIVRVSAENIVKGNCGSKITWEFNKDTGIIVFEGTGDMRDYQSNSDRPWNSCNIKEVIIGSGITSIGDNAFSSFTALEKASIPDSVSKIGNCAFKGNHSLYSITIPDSVETICDGAFSFCRNLEEIDLGKGLKYIGEDAFYYCTYLSEIELPDSVETLKENASNDGSGIFAYCDSLKSVVLSDKIKTIPSYCFAGCKKLESITLPDSVNGIGHAAFHYCSSLKEVKSNNDYCLPANISEIGANAFYNCSELAYIGIPEGVTTIENSTFYGCKNLVGIDIPKSVTEIRSEAFQGCSSLKSIDYAESRIKWNKIKIDVWSYSYIKKADISYKFTGIYNNSFTHNNEKATDGFAGRTGYKFRDIFFDVVLRSKTNLGNYFSVVNNENAEWGGSCYGLTMSIGLNYAQIASCKYMSLANEDIYAKLPSPASDPVLDDLITYYQLSQYLDRSSIVAAKSFRNNTILDASQRKLVEKAALQSMISNDPYILEIGYKSKDGKGNIKDVGHALLVLGNRLNSETQKYELEVYDVNTHCTSTYYISSDYSSFNFGAHGIYDELSQANYRYLIVTRITDLAALESAGVLLEEQLSDIVTAYKASSRTVNSDGSKNLYYDLDSNKNAKITAADGKYVELKNGELSGDLNILDLDIIENEGGGIYRIKLPAGNYTVSGTDADISVSAHDENGYASISGTNIDSAVIDLENGIDISGEDYSFEASVTRTANTEMPLVTVSGSADSDVKVVKTGNDVSVKTQAKLTDVVIKSTDGETEKENSYETVKGYFDLNSDEAKIVTQSLPGDADGNGKVNLKDLVLLQRHLNKWDVVIDLSVCDLNGDNKVNVKDLVLLRRKLTGWKI